MRGTRRVGVIVGLLFALAVLGGCSRQAVQPSAPAKPAEASKPAEPPKPRQTTVTIAGSTSVQPLSEKLAEAFMAKNPDVKINVQGGGSGAGIKAAQTGSADIGSSSRELKPEEKGLQEFCIARDGIAIIVNPNTKLDSITIEQVRKVFSGKITDWKDLGRPAAPITVVLREEGSGTRGAFEELVMKEEKCTTRAAVQNSTGAVRATVASNPNAIGYVSLDGVDSTVKALKLEGVEPTAANVLNGSYKINRPFLYLTREAPSGVVAEFINFAVSPEGQKIVESMNLVRVR